MFARYVGHTPDIMHAAGVICSEMIKIKFTVGVYHNWDHKVFYIFYKKRLIFLYMIFYKREQYQVILHILEIE